jgi:serine/threonine protein kinase
MEENLLYIQTELCSGTLMNEIAAGPLGDQRRYKLLREMLLALEFIHKHDMIHLDIKPANILLKNDQYKLGDFGLVTQASLHQDVEEGDSRYMSLELLNGHHNDLTKSDIFSLGATLYEICSGRPLPLDGQEWQDIRAGRLNPLPNTRHDMAMIIKQMMDPVAANRPSASKLLEHPQLLSDEQKALLSEKSKVLQANIQLAAQARQMNSTAASQLLMPATKRGLVRANTWSGGPLPYT